MGRLGLAKCPAHEEGLFEELPLADDATEEPDVFMIDS